MIWHIGENCLRTGAILVTELSREKQAVAVAFGLPEGDKRKVKENVFGEIELDVLDSENSMSVLFWIFGQIFVGRWADE